MIVAYGKKQKPFNTAEYLTNRAARILPLYYTAMLLMIVYYFIRVNVLHTPSDYELNSGDTFLNTLLVQAWVPGKAFTLNRPAWSLSVEAFFPGLALRALRHEGRGEYSHFPVRQLGNAP